MIYLGKEMIVPARLKKGDTIGICSPCHIAPREGFAPLLAKIRAEGFAVKEATNLYSTTYGYHATPEERGADFNELVADKTVKMILFSGGEGGNEVLPYIDFDAIRENPKIICSYSDGTTILNTIAAKCGLEVYYGQMPKVMKDFHDYDRANFYRHFVDGDAAEHLKSGPWQVQTRGKGEGILIGGYILNCALLFSTKWFDYDREEDYVLFLEGHEKFCGVDYASAVITHIEQQEDFMRRVKGLLFGHFSVETNPLLLARLRRIGEKYGIPVAYCDDFGHGKNHAVLRIGHRAVLDCDGETLTYKD